MSLQRRFCVQDALDDRRLVAQQPEEMISPLIILLLTAGICNSNPDAKRLYDDLLSNYNRLIRPVSNNTDTVVVKLGLRLSQLIDLVRGITCLRRVYQSPLESRVLDERPAARFPASQSSRAG